MQHQHACSGGYRLAVPSPTNRNANFLLPNTEGRKSKSMANSAALSPRSILALTGLLLCLAPPHPFTAQGQQVPITNAPLMPWFAFSWLGYKSSFRAGDTAVIMIRALDLSDADLVRRTASFSATVNNKAGNSTYITDVAAHLEGDPASWNLTFVPIRAGDFVVSVAEERLSIGVSTLQYSVAAAGVHPSASLVSWMYYSGCVAGSKAFLSVIPRDAFGNNVTRGTDMPGAAGEYFRVEGSYGNGTAGEFLDFHYNGWTEDGSLSLEFVPTVAGDFLVRVYGGDNRALRGSPLLLTVKPGPLDTAKSTCSWKHGTNVLQIFSKLEIFINQMDSYGNLVPEIHPFDAGVVERASNLSVPVVDLLIEVVAEGVQLLSFKLVEPGEFVLTMFDARLNQRIPNMVYIYDVFVGYCDGSNSLANGSGIAQSVAGSVSSFMVYLEDQYRTPSPVETAMLQVQILSKNGKSDVNPIISALREPNVSMDGSSSSDQGPADHQKIIAGNTTLKASHFNVSYTPEIAGEYDIWVLCGNIVLNNGNPYAMTVSPGAVNTSLSGAPLFDPMVKRLVRNEITVRLLDSSMNPVVSLEPKLRLHLTSANITTMMNTSSFIAEEFVNNKDGSYTARYVAIYLGSYGMCVQFDNVQLAPCPFEVHVLADEYFSEVQNDSISVWEDESVSFDLLSNDYIAGGQVQVVNLSSPLHGSVVDYNQSYRYTPFKGFFGNDSFSYTVSDKHSNVVSGAVFISVLCRPPEFISLPKQLHVTEDIIGPKFGGFLGIEIIYSDTTENLSVTARAQSGNVLLAPMPMKLQQTPDDVLSVSRGGSSGKELKLQGMVEAINGALKFLKYLGNEDFYGNDVIMLYAMNRNAPKSIFLGGKESREGYQIFGKQRDASAFSIVEPDLRHYPGNKSHLLLELSLEVFEGTLVMTLPAGIVATAELMTDGNNHWQSLQTYVAIAHHFVLRGTGIRFRGDVLDCNNVMQRLFYQGPSHDTMLSITVNDLGNYGCYPDCSEMISRPLSTAKTVRLVKTKSMNSRRSILMGSAIAIEILAMLCLGGVLLYFLLKCMNALKGKQRDQVENEMHKPEQTPLRQHMSAPPSDDAGYCSAPAAVLSFGGNRPSFRQRSSRSCKQEMELQPLSGIRNDGNQNAQPVVDKDK
ncbi:hypothetical protein BRADI_4g30665v3 [Brachypodium distachyon]|uniref:GEX2 N-terminal Ig-like domain-containing protein n=1 Tax=Brachypodium distachyon TaxID=15368 RepID=A0A2K2CRG2_BRADI|nr:hypothetical protein BRADI_4g30665v3 [Brachypodium distachyon]